MKERAKWMLKKIGIYHPLQSFYRNIINFTKNKFYQLSYYKFKGKGFICNFCEAKYEKFVPEYPSKNIAEALNKNQVIAGYGVNVFCPNCMSKNRERLLRAVFENDLPVDNTSILHFSPEKHLHQYLEKKAKVTTVDLLPGFYKSIDRAIKFSDATALQFEDETFEIVIANHILEHIPEDFKAIKQIHSVLKNGGFAILQVPYSENLKTTIEDPFINDPEMQERLYGQKDHVRIYALEDYLERLRRGGFEPKIFTADFLKQYAKYAIQENECVIVAYKPDKTTEENLVANRGK